MSCELDVHQFHAFGFVVLRGCLSAGELSQLEEAYARLIAKAPDFDYFDGGVGTKMITRTEEQDSFIASLIVHPRILEAQLTGATTTPA